MDENRDNKRTVILIVSAILVGFIAIIGLTRCVKKNDNNTDNISETTASTSISIDDKDMNTLIDKILRGENPAGESYINLMCDDYSIIDRYYSEHALYVKVKKVDNDNIDYVMIRFQLTENNEISDYILYNIAE